MAETGNSEKGPSKSEMELFFAFTEEIAGEAGKMIADRFMARSFSVTDKADGSPVTEVDQEAEELIRRRISAQFPDHGIIGEEFGEENTDADFVWVIDPIDGTKSFVHGVPLFGTLIGLLYQKRPILGLIHQPVLGRLVIGDNRETRINGEKIVVNPPIPLADATLLMTDPSDPLFIEKGSSYLSLLAKAGLVRSWGDCFGYLSLVTGQADIMIDPVLSPWDLLPLIPILRGAGAVISDFEGRPVEKGSSLLAASSADLHAEVLKILAGQTD